MEKGKGFLVPVSESSDNFLKKVLAPLQKSYLYEKSKESFRYKSAFLVKNPRLRKKYEAFRAKKKAEGYSKEELKESYGFVLFDDKNKANNVGETGVVTGNSTCTTLGDPSKGAYISKYADCLDENLWSHGKSGYIVIFTLTKGKVKKVSENYTQNFTAPSVGFDCHVSQKLSAVSANTSSFLAFERTQYYMYERLHDGRNETDQSPSHVCPIAIVSFSYTDSKTLPPEEKSDEEKKVFHYLPWSGQLQIGSQLYCVGLKSETGALIPAQLPAILKVDRAISMLVLRQLVPKAVFETCFSGEVSLDGIYCSLYELVPSESEDTCLTLLTQELKEKDLALTIKLKDGGFLMLLHSSHFLTYDDAGSSTNGVVQGIFVYPESRAIQRDTKVGQTGPTISTEILQVLPALNYAETEMEKCSTDKDGESGELCGLLEQHIQSYATLINPGLTSSYRESSIFPDQYDVPDAFKYLYTAPKWTNKAWKSLKSYLSNLISFQLPVSRATELLAAGQEEQREDLADEVYICLSSPEDHLEGQDSPAHSETFMDSHIADSTIVPQSELIESVESRVSLSGNGKSVSAHAETLMDSQIEDSAIKPQDDVVESVESRVSLSDTGKSVSAHAETLTDSQIADSAIKPQAEVVESVESRVSLSDTGKSVSAHAETLMDSTIADSAMKPQDEVVENVESSVTLSDTGNSVSAHAKTSMDSQIADSAIKPQDEMMEIVESRVSLGNTGKSVSAHAETLMDSQIADSVIKPQDEVVESTIVSLSDNRKSVSAHPETLMVSQIADSVINPQAEVIENLESKVSVSDSRKAVSAHAESFMDSLIADSAMKPQDEVVENVESSVTLSDPGKSVSAHAETLMDSQIADTAIKPQDEMMEIVESRVSLSDTGKSVTGVPTQTSIAEVKNLISPTSSDLSTELIVVVSAETATRVVDDNPSTSPTKHELQPSSLNTAKIQMASVDTMNDKLDKAKNSFDCPELNNPSNIDCSKLPRGRGRRRGKSKSLRQISVQTSSIPSDKLPLETSISLSDKCDTDGQPSKRPHLSLKIDLRKLPRRGRGRGRGRGRESGTRRSPRSAVQTSSLPSDKLQLETGITLSDKCDTDGQPPLKLRLKLPPNGDWRKLPRGRSKRRKLRHALRSAAVEGEDKVPNIMERVLLTELEDWPLRKKTERSDLKPVISQCGRILVPHGTVDVAEQIKYLRCKSSQLRNADPIKPMDEDNHLKNINLIDLEQTKIKPPDLGSGILKEHSLESSISQGNLELDRVALTGTLIAVQQKDGGIPLPAEDVKRRDFLLSKLKTVLSGGNKRKLSHLASADATSSYSSQNEPSCKQNKADSDQEMLRNHDSVTSVLDSTKITEKMTLDPDFAHALGLAPKEVLDEVQNTKCLDPSTRDYTNDQIAAQAQVAAQAISEKLLAQTIQRQPTPIVRRKMKTLKKQQNFSTQTIKNKWWLHFHSSSCNLSYNVCTSNNSVRKNQKEKVSTTCPSADALTLLADMALSVASDNDPQQPEPTLERKLDSSLDVFDKDGANPKPESELHALLRQPSAWSMLPTKLPSSKGVGAHKDVVNVVSNEHAYSLPPSSFLLLGLSGIPFQVSPLRGSGGLLQHPQNMYCSEAQAQHVFVSEEDERRRKYGPLHYLQDTCTKKFRQARSFVEKNGSVQVTRTWKENYDFTLDSKFTTDPKDKAVIRALHGPWDFTVPDTFEEVRLIVHMWISLFYSRSTVRFFQIDPNVLHPQYHGDMHMLLQVAPVPVQSELPKSSFAPVPAITPKASDLHQEPPPPYEQAVLDLRVKNQSFLIGHTSDPRIQRNETHVSCDKTEAFKTSQVPEPPSGLHHARVRTKLNDVRSSQGCDATPSQTPWIDLDRTAMPLKSAVCKGKSDVSIQQESILGTHGIVTVLQKSSNEKSEKEACGESRMPDESRIQRIYDRYDLEFSPPDLHIDEDYASDGTATANDVNLSLTEQQSAEEESKALASSRVENVDHRHVEDEVQNGRESESDRIGYGDKDDTPVEDNATMKDSNISEHQNVAPDSPSHKKPGCVESQDEVASQMIDEHHSRQNIPSENVSSVFDENTPGLEVNAAISHSEDILVGEERKIDNSLEEERQIDHSLEEERQIDHSEQLSFQQQSQLSQVKVSEMQEGQVEIPFIGIDNSMQHVLLPLAVHSPDKNAELDRLARTHIQEVIPLLRIESDEQDMLEHFLYSQDKDVKERKIVHSAEERKIDNSAQLSFQHQPQLSQATVSEMQQCRVEIPLIGMDTSRQDMLDFECEQNSPPLGEFDTTISQSEDILVGSQQNDVKGDLSITSSQNSQDQNNKLFEGQRKIDHSAEEEIRIDPKDRVEIPLIGIDTSRQDLFDNCQVESYRQDSLDQFLYSQDKVEEMDIEYKRAHSEIEIPSMLLQGYEEGTLDSQLLESPNKAEKLDQIDERMCGPEEIPFLCGLQEIPFLEEDSRLLDLQVTQYGAKEVFQTEKTMDCNEDTFYSNQQMGYIESEYDDRCPTPTMDEKPYDYMTSCGDEICKIVTGKALEDQLPLDQERHMSEDISPNLHNEQKAHSDLHIRTLRVLSSLSNQLPKSSHTSCEFENDIGMQESSHHFLKSPEEEISHGDATFKETDFLQTCQTNAHAKVLQTVNDHSASQRPIMAVKPSKNDDSGADYICSEEPMDTSETVPRGNRPKFLVATYPTPITTHIGIQAGSSTAMPEDLKRQEITQSRSKARWASDDEEVIEKFNLDEPKLALIDALYKYPESDHSDIKMIPSITVQLKMGQTSADMIEITEKTPSAYDSRQTDGKCFTMGDSTSSMKCTVFYSGRMGSGPTLMEQLSERCQQSDPTQSSVEQECLIFSEQMNQLMKRKRKGFGSSHINNLDRSKTHRTEKVSPITVRFSCLQEQEDSLDDFELQPRLADQRIKVDMQEREGLVKTTDKENTLHLHKLSYGKGHQGSYAAVSDMTSECTRSYQAMMNDVCSGKKLSSKTEGPKQASSYSKPGSSNHVDLSGQMKREMYDSLQSNLNSVVRQSCKTKFRFYILVTSDDVFFKETKAQLEANGHTEVEPFQFFLGEDCPSLPLLIILRNEDIAEHICEVPYLPRLKRSPGVFFAGIDEPDDIVNLTHQEVFSRGGFLVFDRSALEELSLSNVKRLLQALEDLTKKGKWKWMLHYRDSRQLKEDARLSAEAKEKKYLIDCCQEAGMVEVLPYHECDLMSQEQPNYLSCLSHLQVQNISARFPVFITDAAVGSVFGRSGILAMNIEAFLITSQSEFYTM